MKKITLTLKQLKQLINESTTPGDCNFLYDEVRILKDVAILAAKAYKISQELLGKYEEDDSITTASPEVEKYRYALHDLLARYEDVEAFESIAHDLE